jgi:prepilin-type N-terminal cleavage/methylation domain-containing protein
MRRHDTRGFSLIETMIVLAVIIIVTGAAIMTMRPALQGAHVVNAYNITLSAMRQAHDYAVAQRQIYQVTFSNGSVPNTIQITQFGNGNVVATYQLPTDTAFTTIAGMPTAANAVPDGFVGSGLVAINFDQNVPTTPVLNVIQFWPDGTAQDASGNINNGVIYVAMPGQLYNSYAITLWGATGRIRGWRLYNQSGLGAYWRQT